MCFIQPKILHVRTTFYIFVPIVSWFIVLTLLQRVVLFTRGLDRHRSKFDHHQCLPHSDEAIIRSPLARENRRPFAQKAVQ